MEARRSLVSALLGAAVVSGALGAAGQIHVSGTGDAYNAFETTPGGAVTSQMNDPGDLFIAHDLEIGGWPHLSRVLLMSRNPALGDGDQLIYFLDEDNLQGEVLSWDESEDAFSLSDDLAFSGPPGGATDIYTTSGALRLLTRSVNMRFYLDSGDGISNSTPHAFTWFEDGTATDNSELLMRLWSHSPPNDFPFRGWLQVRGGVSSWTGFDLAETFRSAEPLAAGELVAIEAGRPDTVRRTVRAYEREVIGVVSGSPGILVGGTPFSAADLRAVWGDDVADDFNRRRPELEAALYAENERLAAELGRLASPTAFAAELSPPQERAPGAAGGSLEQLSERGWSAAELAQAYRQALLEHEAMLETLCLERFFRERFTRVALAGRVPVQVDASFGAIRAGDPLTPSPTAGAAMKAEGPGPILGTALEGLQRGRGEILVLIHRGWHGGNGGVQTVRRFAGSGSREGERASLAAENLSLRRRVETLERLVSSLVQELPDAADEVPAMVASSAGRSDPGEGAP